MIYQKVRPKRVWICSVIVLSIVLAQTFNSHRLKAQGGYSLSLQGTYSGDNDDGSRYVIRDFDDLDDDPFDNKVSVYVGGANNETDKVHTLTATSSAPSVVSFLEESRTIKLKDGETNVYDFEYKINAAGVALLTINMDNQYSMKVWLYILKEGQRVFNGKVVQDKENANVLKSISRANYNTMRLTWEKSENCDGYMVYKYNAGERSPFESIATICDAEVTKWERKVNWRKTGYYAVYPAVKQEHSSEFDVLCPKNSRDFIKYTHLEPEIGISKISKKAKGKYRIECDCGREANQSILYVSKTENGPYAKLATFNKKSGKKSYLYKTNTSGLHYFKLFCKYPDGKSLYSHTRSLYIAKEKKGRERKEKVKIKNAVFCGGYGEGNWTSPDMSYYYKKKNQMHVVVNGKSSLIDYVINAKHKAKKVKEIKLGKYDQFGGFYYGKDGKYYIALGYDNYEENDAKTVIKVLQYSSNWKKQKVCHIRGSASNRLKGVYIPFDAGTCAMDMLNGVLYMHTCREMYETPDGKHHQSDISFQINTKTMKASNESYVYVSHSFNQMERIKDGDMYLLDHGDGFPRCVQIAQVRYLGTKDVTTEEHSVFDIMGGTCDNYTGVTVGGMEVGGDSVMVAGTAIPHGYTLKGTKGFKKSFQKNVFLACLNKRTGKTTLKWLTTYDPKKKTNQVGEVRMIKISDDRFGLMYTLSTKKQKKLFYLVLDNSGKVLKKKSYKKMAFQAGSQPILFKDSIKWVEGKGKKTYLYSIPVGV